MLLPKKADEEVKLPTAFLHDHRGPYTLLIKPDSMTDEEFFSEVRRQYPDDRRREFGRGEASLLKIRLRD